jgi:hypothetical protein
MKPRCDLVGSRKSPVLSGQEGGAEHTSLTLNYDSGRGDWFRGQEGDATGAEVDDRRRGKAAPGEGDRSRRGLAFPGSVLGDVGGTPLTL